MCLASACTVAVFLATCHIYKNLPAQDVTLHHDSVVYCGLQKPVSASHLSCLSNSLHPMKKLASLWDNCFLRALIANKSHVAHA